MEKERRIKTISVIALIVAVLGLTVAFAVLSTNLVINGAATVEAGKWDIHFDSLSSAKTKGGAKVSGSAIINSENKTMIQDINVTLTKPMDEVTYTVDLINEGTIDAEISGITEPQMDDDAKNYVAFSATYADKKEITKGDILKSGRTEKVMISIKFKEDVTKLPDADIDITLSYQINYVQTSKEVEDNVHNGEANMPKIDYDNLDVGSTVNLGGEEFYCLKNDADTLTLIAKYNLLVGNTVTFQSLDDANDLNFENAKVEPISYKTSGYGLQSKNAKALDFNSTTWIGTIEFAKKKNGDYGYWADEVGNLKSEYGVEYPSDVYDGNASLYEPIQNYKKYLQDQGYNIKNARLITFEELEDLGLTKEDDIFTEQTPKWLYETSYWISLVQNGEEAISVSLIGSFGEIPFWADYYIGLRPVIEISKKS